MQAVFSKLRLRDWDLLAVLAALLLLVTLTMGGASRLHSLRLGLTELTALPLLVVAATELIRTGRWREHRFALTIVAGLVSLPILQLIPLPPALWTSLPGRQELSLALELANIEPGWSTISLTPDRTHKAALALLPPVALFLAMLSAGDRIGRRMILLYLVLAVISMALGAAQMASGGTQFYPWETTDAGSVNGFFANGNHFASFLLGLLPFALVLGAGALRKRPADHLPLWLGAFFCAMVIVTLAAIRSRAGILLFVPITSLALVAAWVGVGQKRVARPILVLGAVIAIALSIVVALAAPRILSRFEESSGEGRLDRWPTVIELAQQYLPVGSGLGSFDPVYRSAEPLHTLDRTFFNQAHNEYLEIWLETGWFGIALLVSFLIWFGRRAVKAWRAPPSTVSDHQRAATIAIILTLAHSAADYPLRTVAFSTLFALVCGLLEVQRFSEGRERIRSTGRRSKAGR